MSVWLRRTLAPLRNSSGLQEIIRFDGLFKGFTFRASQPKKQPNLLSILLALPFIKSIEPDQLFYPEFATGRASSGQRCTEVCCPVFRMADQLRVQLSFPVAAISATHGSSIYCMLHAVVTTMSCSCTAICLDSDQSEPDNSSSSRSSSVLIQQLALLRTPCSCWLLGNLLQLAVLQSTQ